MKAHLLWLLFLLVFIPTADACLNEYHVNKAGASTDYVEGNTVFHRGFNRRRLSAYLDTFDLANPQQYDFKTQSDIAIALAKLGQVKESLAIFRQLSRAHPNEYGIAANLGTLYELNGQIDSALFYIRRGMQLNPDSHRGSEWFHIKVLEAKKKLAADPAWLLKNKVLDMGITSTSPQGSPALEKNTEKLSQVGYQLHERIPFTPAPDLLMANILTEFGDAMALELSVENAIILYEIALVYDSANTFGQKQKRQELVPILKKEGINLPKLGDHFFYPDNWEKEKNEATQKIAGVILDSLFENKKEEKQNNRWWIWAVGAIAIILSFAGWKLYRSRKRDAS